MLSTSVKEHTSSAHQESEKKMIRQLKRIVTTEDYILFLHWLYGYYRPLEDRLRPWLSADQLPDIGKRYRADNILGDIREAGIGVPPSDISTELPKVDSFARALGVLYVLEGSTLGGRIIATMLSRQLGSTEGFSFFNGYGKETENMWLRFKSYLDERSYTEQEKSEILAGAAETFLTFKHRIEKYELQPQL